MSKLYRFFNIPAIITLFITACSAQVVQTSPEQRETPKVALYNLMLGKSLNDKDVVDFITSNNCHSLNQFQLCRDTGVAFWMDFEQIVKTVYLYSGNAEGFRRYQGVLPYKLSFYDPMWKVEEKLKDPNADEKSQPNQKAGLPDEAGSPDHIHYWAVYKRLGLTVIYDSPGADEDAYIYAILINH